MRNPVAEGADRSLIEQTLMQRWDVDAKDDTVRQNNRDGVTVDVVPAPDVLVMTATPIPRTLTMTIYGDLDVSTIDEMPRNRGKIVTAVRDTSKLGEVLSFLRTQLEKGRQLYVIYPLIDESDKLDVKAAAAEYELWRERLHPFRCELLHGRIPASEKQPIMDRFRRGDTNALISTTVLEVGVAIA